MGATHKQYQLTQLGGPFAIVSVETPAPEPHQVTIELKAIALNPVDNKQIDLGIIIEKYPAVIGIEGAGVVTAVGSAVSAFKPGDKVMGLFSAGTDSSRAFQEFAVVPENMVAKIPAELSFEDAASLPIGYVTAATAMLESLKIPLTWVPAAPAAANKPKSVLVLGGSSAVGSCAIQLLRIALPDTIIITTSSAKHHAHTKELGANHAFDQNSPSLIADIKAATPGGKGVDVMLDAVAGALHQPKIFETLDPNGLRIDAEVATGTDIAAPADVQHDVVYGYTLYKLPDGDKAMAALTTLVEQGKYRVPITVKTVGKGFDAIKKGLAELAAGVSGTKLIVQM